MEDKLSYNKETETRKIKAEIACYCEVIKEEINTHSGGCNGEGDNEEQDEFSEAV